MKVEHWFIKLLVHKTIGHTIVPITGKFNTSSMPPRGKMMGANFCKQATRNNTYDP
jgi:hypothetical protein